MITAFRTCPLEDDKSGGLTKLADAQAITDERLKELAEAQKATDERLRALINVVERHITGPDHEAPP